MPDERTPSSGDHRTRSGISASGKRRPRWLYVLGGLLLVLLIIHLVGSPIARAVVNRKLAQLPGHVGKAEAVKIALWRGGVEVNDFVLRERGHEDAPPMVHIKKATMKFAPGALFTGKLGGRAVVDGFDLNLIKRERIEEPVEKAKNEIQETKEKVQAWQQALLEAFPMELTHLEVKNARVHFRDLTHQPHAEFGLEQLHIVARDLQNRPEGNGDPLPAKVDVTGITTGDGKLRIQIQLDPVSRQPRFAMNFELLGQSLPPLNSFLLAYADADVSRGSFEVYSEINAQNGAYDGYLKPLFHDMDFRTASDKHKSLGERVKENVVGAVSAVLKNDDNEQVATKAPFAGNFADNDVDIWTTISNLLRNAFVQAIRGGLDGEQGRG